MNAQEEILWKLGLDASSMQRGTQAAMDVQKKAALDYVAFWKKATDEREAIDAKATEKFIAQIKIREDAEKASLAKRMAAAEAFAANNTPERWAIRARRQKAIEDDIARGSGAFGSIDSAAKKAEAAKAETERLAAKAARLGKTIEEVQAIEKEAGNAAHGFAGILRESTVIVREGFRGNFTRMLGSVSILIGQIGTLAAAVAIPLAAILAVPGYRTFKAYQEKNESEKDLKVKVEDTADQLRERVRLLKEAGIIDKKTADDHINSLRQPTADSVNAVLSATNKLMPKGGVDQLAQLPEIHRIDAEITRKNLEAQRELLPLAYKIMSLDLQRHELLIKNSYLNKDSLEYHQNLAQIADLTLEINRDQVDLEKQKTEEAKRQAEIKKQAAAEDKKKQEAFERASISGAMDEAVYPTYDELAGGSYVQQLNADYAPGKWVGRGRKRHFTGGKFGMEEGTGPYAANAQDYLLAQKQQIFDRANGNMEAAEGDRQRMIAERNYLVNQGVASPEQLLSKIEDNTEKLHTLFTGLVASGALAVSVTDAVASPSATPTQ